MPNSVFGFPYFLRRRWGRHFGGADALVARRLGVFEDFGASGGCARARRSRRSVTAGVA